MAIINEYIDISSELSVSSSVILHQDIDLSANTYANCSLSVSISVIPHQDIDVSANTYANCSLSVSSSVIPHQEIDVSADTYANCSLSVSSGGTSHQDIDVSADTYANCSLSLSTLDATLANTRVSCSLDVASESSGDVSNTHINVVIGGYKVDISPGSLSISGNLGSRTVCSFQIPSTYPFSESYEIGAAVEIKDKSGNLIFGGTIDTDLFVVDNSRSVRTYQIQCVDYNQIADRHLVSYAYVSNIARTWYAGTIIKDVVERFFSYADASENIDVSNVADGPVIEKAVFNYIPASQVFSELADLAGFVWYIDFEKRMYFFDSSSNAAPFGLTSASENWRDMRITESREQYRNRQIVVGGNSLTDERDDSFAAEADQKLFVLPFKVGTALHVYVDTVEKTLGINGLDEGKEFYWSYGSPTLTAETAPGAGKIVKLVYKGLFPILITEENSAEIMARRAIEGGTGVYEAIADDTTISLQETGVMFALAYLRKYSTIPKTIEFGTDTAGLRAGQLITVNIPELDLTDDFLIESVNIKDYGGRINRYKINAVSGEALGGWLDFFNSLARQSQNLRLYDDEQVGILRENAETINVSDAAETDNTGKPESRTDLARADFGETDWVHP